MLKKQQVVGGTVQEKEGTVNFCCNVLIKEGQHENRY